MTLMLLEAAIYDKLFHQVLPLMKIFKKIFEIDGEKTTSFRMKYAVENILADQKYETEPVGSSLKNLVDIEGYQFEKVSKPLIERIGVTKIKIDYEKEEAEFEMREQFNLEEEPEPSPSTTKRKILLIVACFLTAVVLIGVIVAFFGLTRGRGYYTCRMKVYK